MKEPLWTGNKFLGCKILIDSTGDAEVDEALLAVFNDYYRRTAPLYMTRKDVQLVLAWSRREYTPKKVSNQMLLFNEVKK